MGVGHDARSDFAGYLEVDMPGLQYKSVNFGRHHGTKGVSVRNGAFAGYSFVDVPDMRYKFVNLEGYRGAEGVGVGTPAVPSPAIFKLTSRKRSRMVALSRGFQVPSLGVGGQGVAVPQKSAAHRDTSRERGISHSKRHLRCCRAADQRTWHMQDSQGQILALAFRQKPSKRLC